MVDFSGVALPAAAVREFVLKKMPGEFAEVGPFQAKQELYPFLRITQIGGQPVAPHGSVVSAYLQLQVFHEHGKQWECYVLAQKLAQKMIADLPGFRCDYGAAHHSYAVNGPMWIQPLSSDDDGGYSADFVVFFRPDKLA